MADEGFNAQFKQPGMRKQKTVLFNAGVAVTATGWTNGAMGGLQLAVSKTAKYATIPCPGLHVGDKIVNFRVMGGFGGTATFTASFEKALHASAGATTAEIAHITTLSVGPGASDLNAAASCSEEVVAAGYQYYVVIMGTTQEESLCTIDVTGVELDIRRA